ncbi:hypothetical protein BJY16_001773 [Actinoplanes octamycinicus]|uniref:Uncharacterized protein n=1 Tax=Actinoplanes octamycinicus TaxID=135948 RepID=A0A7W7GU08_9ACTN|nr:hypothetical protein [Actinoplanes octamycinicus]MBB4738314.1 hypothetical protein [Actinoplanes octamycinicus]GIE57431.1 hypothetical protein Aoc01nite_28330 [Actinoplanes octamycinicus]
MKRDQVDRDDLAAAAAVLDATAAACLEYEVGAHGALRIVRAFEDVAPELTADLIDDLDDDQAAYDQVQPEAVGEAVAEVAERLHAAIEEPPQWPEPAPSGYRPVFDNALQGPRRAGPSGVSL